MSWGGTDAARLRAVMARTVAIQSEIEIADCAYDTVMSTELGHVDQNLVRHAIMCCHWEKKLER
jgi:hypothetical protein